MIRLNKRSNLAEQITERLFKAILQGELTPGERIIETKMARQLGVGQSTFREALQALEHRGLVTKGRGTFVTKLTVQDVELLLAVRLDLEPLAASLACGKLTTTQIEQLEGCLNEMKKARQRRDFAMLLKNDLSFHELIWQAPEVDTLKRILNLVMSPLFVFYFTRHSQAFSTDPTLAEETFRKEHEDHCKLLAALKKGNPDEAKRASQVLIQYYILDLKAEQALRTSSQPFPASGQMPVEVSDLPR